MLVESIIKFSSETFELAPFSNGVSSVELLARPRFLVNDNERREKSDSALRVSYRSLINTI